MVDFSHSAELLELRDRIGQFIREKIVPLEHDPRQGPHGPEDALIREMQEMARKAGFLSPHAPEKWGGLGLDHVGMAVIFEAACYSSLGMLALNIQAPDEGNTNLLAKVGTPEQNEKWLRPLVEGKIRTVFQMTEPDNGAGSDPSLMKTSARQKGDHYIINGTKWLITGYPGAGLHIIMARTFDEAGEDVGATMFLVPEGTPGMKMVRLLDTMDSNSPGGHGVVELKDVKVKAEDILGQVGKGFRNAQVRLGPARLTHCMRWLGQAVRCHDIAVDYAQRRQSFGKAIGYHQGIGFQLADNEIDLDHCRLSILHCAWLMDQGEMARKETSQSKVYCSEALGRVVDRCVQVLGGLGITSDTIVERTYRDIRAFRIYDGPSEVHRHVLANGIMKRAAAE
ncbi:acyl-CoA dehydrogenase family protein [Sneathiella sp.]|uniref:acyl-CoA dehydrogenase family protein n=1 Tax=Sneathiella sp. TaxID=1964365 RepID=UPI0026222B53|nr:acyl-CoA dehydrogenase family protein [Sneathiella sp.]MDF2367972.1 acyl-CoA/acyl-ACP dehydrogenase [Sneathiella sp.]